MQIRHFTAALALISASSLLFTAHADRRTGLAGNLLIEDADDVFIFPQKALNYARRVSFDYGPSEQTGSGYLLVGNDSSAFGIAINRTEVTHPLGDQGLELARIYDKDYERRSLGGPGNPFEGIFTAPATVFDLFYATKVGEDALGFRLGLANGAQWSEPDGSGDNSNSQTSVNFQIGYSMPGTETRADLVANFAYSTASIVNDGNDGLSGTAIVAEFDGRLFHQLDIDVDLGMLATIGIGSVSLDDDSNEASDLGLLALFGIGPVYKLSGQTTIAGYALMAYASNTRDPGEGGDDEIKNSNLILPGARLSLEHGLTEWLLFRTGMEYTFVLNSTARDSVGDSGQRLNSFGWNAGLGVQLDNFTFDGALSHSFLTNGPNFIGGGSGFLSQASAAYKF